MFYICNSVMHRQHDSTYLCRTSKDEFMIYMGTIDALNPDNVEGVVVNTSIIEPVRLPSLAQRHQQYNKDYNAILSGGDQGGPLTVEDSDGIVTQIGISSLFNCGRSYPHIYTRVVNYLEWIAKNGGPPLIPSSKYHKKN
ncbi:hypothetical protein B566_EDAN015590 [Ephemera danica]|nr:hypothetical protein B566_EDAN015590 [Ephemera danica]